MIITSFLSWTGLLLAAAVAFGGLQVDQAGSAPAAHPFVAHVHVPS